MANDRRHGSSSDFPDPTEAWVSPIDRDSDAREIDADPCMECGRYPWHCACSQLAADLIELDGGMTYHWAYAQPPGTRYVA